MFIVRVQNFNQWINTEGTRRSLASRHMDTVETQKNRQICGIRGIWICSVDARTKPPLSQCKAHRPNQSRRLYGHIIIVADMRFFRHQIDWKQNLRTLGTLASPACIVFKREFALSQLWQYFKREFCALNDIYGYCALLCGEQGKLIRRNFRAGSHWSQYQNCLYRQTPNYIHKALEFPFADFLPASSNMLWTVSSMSAYSSSIRSRQIEYNHGRLKAIRVLSLESRKFIRKYFVFLCMWLCIGVQYKQTNRVH